MPLSSKNQFQWNGFPSLLISCSPTEVASAQLAEIQISESNHSKDFKSVCLLGGVSCNMSKDQ